MGIKISGFQVGASFSLPQYGPSPTYYATGFGSQHGGTGLIQVSFDAPANSTTLVFTSQDAGYNDNDQWIQGYNWAVARQNGGATYWEYLNVSTKDNSTSVTNEIATSTGFSAGNWIAIAESLKGVSAVPSLVDVFSGESSSNSQTTFPVTVNDGEIIVLSTAVELGTSYATVTTPGLTWIRKSSKSVLSSFSNVNAQTMEIWYAINTSGSTINETTAITYSGNYDDAAAVALTYSGVDLASPWA